MTACQNLLGRKPETGRKVAAGERQHDQMRRGGGEKRMRIEMQAARRIGREEEEQLRCARCREHGGLRPTFSASFDDGAKREEGRQHN